MQRMRQFSHVFSMRVTSRVQATQTYYAATQTTEEERDAHFRVGNTITILSICQLKKEISRFVVLWCWWRQSAIKLQKHDVKFEETFGVAALHSQIYRANPVSVTDVQPRVTRSTVSLITCDQNVILGQHYTFRHDISLHVVLQAYTCFVL